MKVGILTWYDVLNYGSFFQAYALQETLKEMGCQPELLRHDRIMPDYFGNRLSLTNIHQWFRNQSPNRVKNRRLAKEKYEKFTEARQEYLDIGAHYSETDADLVLIGSDQIFDINGLYYPFQFGKGISCGNIGTYAPSFGETTLERLQRSEHYEEIKKSVCNLSVVNARDANTQHILSVLGRETAPLVVDPVLLYSFKKEKEKWNNRLISEKYCIVYTWGGYTTSESFAKQCVRFAKENNLCLVSLGEIRRWCDIQYAAASPIEFFELFRYADMVLTNMFHGTCFSILMEKPFYSFVMPHNENKLGGLLKFFALDSCLVSAPDALKMEPPLLDDQQVRNDLQQKRHTSMDILRGILNPH